MSKKELKYLILIIVTFIAACIETDIYLPTFPQMMRYFAVSEGEIQSLLTWNFLGICLSGPFYGPISDAYGRKKPLLFALSLFFLGSIGTLVSKNFDLMLWGRLLQGLGSGGCFTLGTAIIFDAFQKDRAIRMTNHLNMIVPLIMAAAPMVGGILNQSFGFRANFLLIASVVLASLATCSLFFEETLPKEKRCSLHLIFVFKDFVYACKSLPFWQLTIATSLLFAGYIAFLSVASVLFVVELRLSPSLFPWVQATVLGGWVIASLTLESAMKKFGGALVKKMGVFLCVVGGVIFALFSWIASRNPYALTAGMVFYAFGANWVIGLYFPEGMEVLPRIKGIAASLLTSARLLIAAIVVWVTSVSYNGTIVPCMVVVVLTVILMLWILNSYERKKKESLYREVQ